MKAGSYDRALKHWMIAVRDGGSNSLDAIKRLYEYGNATKDDYAKALRLYQAYLGGLPQDRAKALDLYRRAATLGNAEAYYRIGHAYMNGYGVEVDMKKAVYYYEIAAMRGNATARHNLGWYEHNTEQVMWNEH